MVVKSDYTLEWAVVTQDTPNPQAVIGKWRTDRGTFFVNWGPREDVWSAWPLRKMFRGQNSHNQNRKEVTQTGEN